MARFEMRIDDALYGRFKEAAQGSRKSVAGWLKSLGMEALLAQDAEPLIPETKEEPNATPSKIPPATVQRCRCGGTLHPIKQRCMLCNQKASHAS